MQRGFSIIITSPTLRSYTCTPFFASGKAARFAESSRPRTLSGHLIPIRYFSLLSCSSLSWASCFFPSLLPTLPTTSLTAELSPPLSYFLAVPSFSQSLSEYAVLVDHQQPALLSCVHPYADSWQAVTDATKCHAAAAQDCKKPFCNTMKRFHFFFEHLLIHRTWCAGHAYTNDNLAAQGVPTSPNLKEPCKSPHPKIPIIKTFLYLCYCFFSKLFFFGPCPFKIIQGYYS